MGGNKYNFEIEIPTQEELEHRFAFIDDSIIRDNINIAFRYIVFLISLDNSNKLPGPIHAQIRKTIIVYTASIVESTLHYCLRKLIDRQEVLSSEIMPTFWKLNQIGSVLFKVPDEEKYICGAEKIRKTEKLQENTDFKTRIEACRRAEVLNDTLTKKAHELRELRNKVHLTGLKESDLTYNKEILNAVFDVTANILKSVENKLSELKHIET